MTISICKYLLASCLCLTSSGLVAQSSDSDKELVFPAAGCESSSRASECVKLFIEQNRDTIFSSDPNASYALGVRFQSEVISIFEEFEYAQFLTGILDQSGRRMTFSDKQLNDQLDKILLSKKEISDRFVKEFSERPRVISWKGIYYIDHNQQVAPAAGTSAGSMTSSAKPTTEESAKAATKDTVQKAAEDTAVVRDEEVTTGASGQRPVELQNNPPGCTENEKNDEKQKYIVEYHRLDFDKEVNVQGMKQQFNCIRANEGEIIRGWRTALTKMTPGDVWELVVPASQAYGDEGTTSKDASRTVAEGEALRFLIHLVKKNQ